jgi:hypothetical protein
MAQQSLTPAVDWLDSLIGQGEFLLLVSHLFAVPVLDFMGGVGKSKKVNLDVRDIFAGLHTEHHRRCSKELRTWSAIVTRFTFTAEV